MKICHMTSAHNQDDTRIFHKECVSLAKAGYDTYLVARGESCERDGVHIVGVGQPSGGRLSRMTKFAKKVYQKALELNADVYHLHDPELLPFGLKLKKQGGKVIFDSHEDTLNQMIEKEWIPILIRPLVSVIYRGYATKAFMQYDALLTVTPHLNDMLKDINPNTFMITNYPEMPKSKAETVGFKTEVFSLCFTGGISNQWCQAEIIRAMECVGNVSYILCGAGSETYLSELKALPGWKKVDFKGKLPFEQMFAIQNASSVGMAVLRASRNSGGKLGTLGNTKIFEYMMAGLPIICTDFVLWRKIVDCYHCGICVNPDDVDSIARAIHYLKDHPDEARQMGQNGRKAVEQKFNWETQKKVLLELYEKLLRGSRNE